LFKDCDNNSLLFKDCEDNLSIISRLTIDSKLFGSEETLDNYENDTTLESNIDINIKMWSEEKVDLSDNKLKKLPKKLKIPKKIKSLDLSNNNFDYCIFKDILELKELKSLNLGFNKIEKLPKKLYVLSKLRNLVLSGGVFINVPDEIEKLKIEKLILVGIQPDMYFAEENDRRFKINFLINIFLNIQSLKYLDIRGNGLSYFGYKGDYHGLRILKLGNNNMRSLSESLLRFNCLYELDLSSNNLEIVPDFLVQFTNLEKLNLSYNKMKSYNTFDLGSITSLILDLRGSIKDLHIFNEGNQLEKLILIRRTKYFKISEQTLPQKSFKRKNTTMSVRSNKNGNLETLKILKIYNAENEDINDLNYKLENLRELHISFNRSFNMLPNLFSTLQKGNHQCETLFINNSEKPILLSDEIFKINGLKILFLEGFVVNEIKMFTKLTNLKTLELKKVVFNNNKEYILNYFKLLNIGCKLKNCQYDRMQLSKKIKKLTFL
ncbi:Leucine rich repeat protein, partial [Spraguea lophii 42_110]